MVCLASSSTAARSMPGGDLNSTSSRIMRISPGGEIRSGGRAPRDHHVVHVHVGGQPPAVGEEIVDHPGLVDHGEAVPLERGFELVGSDELLPLVRAARQPAQHVFGADDRQCKALERAVERRRDHEAARLHHLSAAADEEVEIGDVLDHLHGEHEVEALARVRQRLGRGRAVVHAHPRVGGVQLRRRDIGLRGIGAHDGGAEPRQRLAQNAAAAADVEHAELGERIEPLVVTPEMPARRLFDEAEPHRIELVQHGHLAARIPPLRRQRREASDLRLVDGRRAPASRIACHPPSKARLRPSGPAAMYTRLFARGLAAKRSRASNPWRTAQAAMARLVMKFGGTSVADIERIRNVARHVKREVDAGHEVAVIVSAMAGATNQLVAWCSEAAALHDAREYDAVVSSGEQVTAGLLAIVLEGMGVNARSWQGWQLPILTSNAHASARILEVNGGELVKRFKERYEVAVIAGFQGMHKETGRVTTLGRGGSDTSAVAVAAAIAAERCDIYTDVDGVYTSDPRVVPRAQRLDRVAYEEMLELASLGAKVLQVRSVELGMVHNVRIFVRSSFEKPEDIDPHGTPPGTLICGEEEIVEQQVVTGIAFSKDEAQISLRRVQDKPGVAAAIFGPLAEANINVDMIVQNVSGDGATTDVTFTVPASDYQRAADVLVKAKGQVGYERLDGANDVAKISVIGIGMRSHAGVAAKAFKALAEKGINIRAITTSEIKFSLLIDANYTELAVRTLHSLYELDK